MHLLVRVDLHDVALPRRLFMINTSSLLIVCQFIGERELI